MNKDKINSRLFYFRIWQIQGSFTKTTHNVDDNTEEYLLLKIAFTLDTVSRDSVQAYPNGRQLTHNKDYTFNSEGFCLTANNPNGDLLDIYEYENNPPGRKFHCSQN